MNTQKPGLGTKIKNMFGGKKKNIAGQTVTLGQGETVVEEHIHKEKIITTIEGGAQQIQAPPLQPVHQQHLHGPLVANPYAQPAHGQIFVPANTAVQANPETGALLPASSLNGPVILPTGPKVVPIATNYPAGQAGPMVIPPSGGFINNSGNPYLTQQSYGPAGITAPIGLTAPAEVVAPVVMTTTQTYQTDFVDPKAIARLEKEELRHEKALEKEEARQMKAYEKEQRRLEKEEMKREKALEKEARAVEKDQMKLEKQMEKDRAKLESQLAKDQAKLYKDQEKLEATLAKDEVRLESNQIKLQDKAERNESKIENRLIQDQMKMDQLYAQQAAAPLQAPLPPAPITTGYTTGILPTGLAVGGHGVKHVYAEETKQDAITGQVLDHNIYHKDTRF